MEKFSSDQTRKRQGSEVTCVFYKEKWERTFGFKVKEGEIYFAGIGQYGVL